METDVKWNIAWLALATAFAAFAIGNMAFPLAAWLAPLFMLRFLRGAPPLMGLTLGALAFALAHNIGWRDAIIFQGLTYHLVAGGLGLVFFLPYAVDRLFATRLRSFASTLVFPAALVVTEFAWSQAGLGSWGAGAYSQWGELPLLQSVSIGGLWAVTFLIGWTASAANLLWARGVGDRAARVTALTVSVVLFAVLSWGGVRLAIERPAAPSVRIAGLVVDNIAVFNDTWGPVARGRELTPAMAEAARPGTHVLFASLLDATRTQARAGARIVVWSEANALVLADDEAGLLAEAAQLAREEEVYLFLGLATLAPGRALAENKLVVIDPEGRILPAYLKSNPTPVETSVRGNGVMPFIDTPYGRIAWAICYDFDFTDLIRQAGRAGADIMVNPSWDSPGMDPMHTHMAGLRAIENGAAMVRITNDGLSMAVDAHGRVLATMERGAGPVRAMVAHVPTRGVATLYAAFGDWLAWASMLILAALLVMAAVSGRKRA